MLPRRFYARTPVTVARDLIGKTLVRRLSRNKRLGGVIVETEAYGGKKDPASHAYIGRTQRNSVMFGEAGHAYVYFTYGMHYCLNFVTGKPGGEGAGAVLIRAIEPVLGVELMDKLRNVSDPRNLTNGPAKLCQALSIDLSLNGCDVTSETSEISVEDRPKAKKVMEICSSSRIGIKLAIDRKWRFFARGNRYVSAGANIEES